MAKLIYSAITSLDGYVADEAGDFGLLAPDEEVHAFANDLERSIGTQLYGRRMYEVMVAWETMGTDGDESPVTRDFGARAGVPRRRSCTRPRSSRRVVPRTRIERAFDPGAIAEMKASATADISIGGPGLAGLALKAGLVDDCHVFVVPVLFGGGTHFAPDGLRLELELLDEHRFGSGVVHLHYSSS